MSRPDVCGVPKEVLAYLRILGEIFGERAMSLENVARATRRHYVARRTVSSAQARLHVIERQCRRRVHTPAVDAPESVPRENLITRHG
jgi:hypothetical protein